MGKLKKIENKHKNYEDYVKVRFNRCADHYDSYNRLVPFKNIVRNKATKYINDLNPKKIIEVGSGTGEQTLLLKGEEVHGIDISKDMIDLAKKKSDKVKFEVMDATKTNFEDNYFDVVCSAFTLHEMPVHIIDKVIKEVKRISNKHIVIVDYALPNNFLKGLGYNFVKFYECRYYPGFVKTNLPFLFKKHGLEFVEEIPLALGFVKIYKLNV